MARPINKIKFGLKLRAEAREGVLTLRMGVKKYVLPFEARMLSSDDYVFVHIPPTAEIMRVDGRQLVVVTKADEAEEAAKTFRKKRRKSSRGDSEEAELPDNVKEALNKIPDGYRLGYDADGQPRLVKTRRRRKK